MKSITHESDHTALEAVCAALGIPIEWVGRHDVENALDRPPPEVVALTVRCQRRDHLLGRVLRVENGLVWMGLRYKGRPGSPRDANWRVEMYNPDGPDHVVPTPSLTIRDFTWLRRHGELQMFAVGWRCRCGGPGGDAAAETLIAQADAGRRTPYRV